MSIKHLTHTEKALRCLKECGYPLSKIRKAMAILLEQKHEEIGLRIGKSRSAVTNALDLGIGSEETLRAIARIMGVPVGELFADNRRYLNINSLDSKEKYRNERSI